MRATERYILRMETIVLSTESDIMKTGIMQFLLSSINVSILIWNSVMKSYLKMNSLILVYFFLKNTGDISKMWQYRFEWDRIQCYAC